MFKVLSEGKDDSLRVTFIISVINLFRAFLIRPTVFDFQAYTLLAGKQSHIVAAIVSNPDTELSKFQCYRYSLENKISLKMGLNQVFSAPWPGEKRSDCGTPSRIYSGSGSVQHYRGQQAEESGAKGDHDRPAREATIATRIFPHGCAPAPAPPPIRALLGCHGNYRTKNNPPLPPHPRTSDPFQILILLETSDIRIHTKIARHLDSLAVSLTPECFSRSSPPPCHSTTLSRHVTVSPSRRADKAGRANYNIAQWSDNVELLTSAEWFQYFAVLPLLIGHPYRYQCTQT